jgi:branched-chain amino acid transport system substrate-binding protein
VLPNTVNWSIDTWALAHGTGSAMTKRGGDSWFFLTADYAFGLALERDATEQSRRQAAAFSGRSGILSSPRTSPPSS